jgi:transcriptional regulator with XRE-family HTH domain
MFIILNIRGDYMGKKSIELLPSTMEILSTMGAQIKMARLRRNLSVELVAERANISRATLWNIEKGSPSVAIGNYAAVLHALNNMDSDLLLIAKDDELGRKLQDLNLVAKKRAVVKED